MWQNVSKMESRGADTFAKGQLKSCGSDKCFQNDVAEHKKNKSDFLTFIAI